MRPGVCHYPNLARRALDIDLLKFPGTTYSFRSGKELVYRMKLSPSAVSRIYTCELHVRPGVCYPEVIVIHPDLKALAPGKKLPHVYPHKGKGTKLCLWLPDKREWHSSMKLSETFVPWTVQWLWYFEDWLHSGEWAGGGNIRARTTTGGPTIPPTTATERFLQRKPRRYLITRAVDQESARARV